MPTPALTPGPKHQPRPSLGPWKHKARWVPFHLIPHAHFVGFQFSSREVEISLNWRPHSLLSFIDEPLSTRFCCLGGMLNSTRRLGEQVGECVCVVLGVGCIAGGHSLDAPSKTVKISCLLNWRVPLLLNLRKHTCFKRLACPQVPSLGTCLHPSPEMPPLSHSLFTSFLRRPLGSFLISCPCVFTIDVLSLSGSRTIATRDVQTRLSTLPPFCPRLCHLVETVVSPSADVLPTSPRWVLGQKV